MFWGGACVFVCVWVHMHSTRGDKATVAGGEGLMNVGEGSEGGD